MKGGKDLPFKMPEEKQVNKGEKGTRHQEG